MLFWAIYGIVLAAGWLFFVCALRAYLRERRAPPAANVPAFEVLDLEPAFAALYAQALVAPSLALEEARRLLSAPAAADGASFEEVMELLEAEARLLGGVLRLDPGAAPRDLP